MASPMFQVNLGCYTLHVYTQCWETSSVQQLSRSTQMIGTFFLLQMRRGVTVYDRERQLWASCLGLYCLQLSLLSKIRCLLHDIPPQTFIRPPKMVTFLTIVVVLTRGRFFSPHWYNMCTFLPFELHLNGCSYKCVLISRLSWDKENRVPDKCSWRAVNRYGARCHRSSLCWKVSYPFILSTPVFQGFGFYSCGQRAICLFYLSYRIIKANT